MDKIIKISEKTNIVIHALTYLATDPTKTFSVKQMANDLKVSTSYLAKVLQPLVKEGLLKSVRGANGGFALLKDPSEIEILPLLSLLEGDFPEHGCLFGTPICKKESCSFSNLQNEIKDLIIKRLKGLTIKDITSSF